MANTAVADTGGNNIAATYDKKPLVIEVDDVDDSVPQGTYDSITAALSAGRDVLLKVTITEDGNQIEYLRLREDCVYESTYVFANTRWRTEIYSDDAVNSEEASENNHLHGNITSGGTLQFGDITIANGDKLVVTDASQSNVIARASLTFDGSTTTQALSKKGTWETFYQKPSAGIPETDLASAVQTSLGKADTSVQKITSTDNAIARFDGTGGQIQNSGVTINDSNHVTAAKFITSSGTSSQFVKGDGSLDSTAYAPLASPALTGTPTAPTAAAGTNTTQIATTAFVQNALSNMGAGGSEMVDVTITGTTSSASFSANPYTAIKTVVDDGKIAVLNASVAPISTGVLIPVYAYTYSQSGMDFTGYKGSIQHGGYEISVDVQSTSSATVTITEVSASVTVDTALSESSTNPVQNRVITAQILENEEIVATALNNLNDRVEAKQDVLVSGTTIKTINGNSILGSGNITISGGSGGGGDVNVIETVKVNGTALVPDANKAVDVTVPQNVDDIIPIIFKTVLDSTTDKGTYFVVPAPGTTDYTDTGTLIVSLKTKGTLARPIITTCQTLYTQGQVKYRTSADGGTTWTDWENNVCTTKTYFGTYTSNASATTLSDLFTFSLSTTFLSIQSDVDAGKNVILVFDKSDDGDSRNRMAFIYTNTEAGNLLIFRSEVLGYPCTLELTDNSGNLSIYFMVNQFALEGNLAQVALSGDYADLENTPTIPTSLSELTPDATHRVVTDTEKSTWNGKQDTLVSGTNIKTVNNNSLLGSGNISVGTYSKPSGGIPKTDLATAVQTSLGKADTALQPDENNDLGQGTLYASSSQGFNYLIADKDTSSEQTLQDALDAKASTSAVNAKYTKPSGGIPSTDLASAVTTSLGKADSSVQDIQAKVGTGTAASIVNSSTKIATITLDSTPTSGSTNTVTSGGVYTAVNAKYTKPSGGIPETDLATAVTQRLIPSTSGSTDDGKIVQYSYMGGGWQLVKPITIYTGSTAPSSGTGSNGDIYIQTS